MQWKRRDVGRKETPVSIHFALWRERVGWIYIDESMLSELNTMQISFGFLFLI